MGKHGLKIKNIESSTLYETNLGIRSHFEYKDSMFTNSLFYDFLLDNGMTKWHEKSTRDIICLEFNWGTRSYDEEIARLHKTRKKYVDLEIQESVDKVDELISIAKSNEYKYKKMTKADLRDYYYKNGADVKYITRNKQGEIINSEIIHYKMLYRSTGKAKKGSCMFIAEHLYDICKDYLTMGIDIGEKNAPIVEMSAYCPLVSSTVVDKIKIEPENILVLKDIDVFFNTDIISVETDENKKCIAKKIDNYRLKNTIFDGQGLIDSSIFPKWADGYILLRHHMCKVASFCSNIQLFMKDYFGDLYETAKIMDMFGNEHYAKDILFITTENAMKWLKLDVSYDYWCEKISENGSYFGIVKTAHESKLGDVQRMSYQMVNSLDVDIMDKVVEKNVEYITQLKSDENLFIEYLEKNSNFSNDFKVIAEIAKWNTEFVKSEYYRERKRKIIEKYSLNFKSGKVIQNGDNLVIVGSPYAMLLHSVGEDIYKDDTFDVEDCAIQCYTNRFNDGEYLAEFRSPFNSKNNMGYLHNRLSEKIDKYFNLGNLVIAVNMIGTDFQDKNNG